MVPKEVVRCPKSRDSLYMVSRQKLFLRHHSSLTCWPVPSTEWSTFCRKFQSASPLLAWRLHSTDQLFVRSSESRLQAGWLTKIRKENPAVYALKVWTFLRFDTLLVFCAALSCEVHAAASFFKSSMGCVRNKWTLSYCSKQRGQQKLLPTYAGAAATLGHTQEPVMLTLRHGRIHIQLLLCNDLNIAGGMKFKPVLVMNHLSLFSTFCFSLTLPSGVAWAYPWYGKKTRNIFKRRTRHTELKSKTVRWEKA